jgi:peptidoglycan hydrolase-like protein with peptidoglycan-binding domain
MSGTGHKLPGTKIADYLDEKIKTAEKPVLEFLEENQFLTKVLFVTEVSWMLQGPIGWVNTQLLHPGDTMRGYADLFRVGQGSVDFANGGAGVSVVQDGVRGVGIIGMLRGGVNGARIGSGRISLRFMADPKGGFCAAMAPCIALRRNGLRPFVLFKDLIKAAGLDPDGVGLVGSTVADVRKYLNAAKIKFGEVPAPLSMADLEALVRKSKKTTLFTVDFRQGTHTMAAYVDDLGRFRIHDRTGKVVSSLKELDDLFPNSGYSGIGDSSTRFNPSWPLFVVDGLKVISLPEGGALALQVATAIAIGREDGDPEFVVQALESKILRAQGGTCPVPKLAPAPVDGLPKVDRRKVAPRPDWLTGVKHRLNHLGYGAGHIRGGSVAADYDDRCKRAIRAFQKDSGLRVDGIPGPATQAKLVATVGY